MSELVNKGVKFSKELIEKIKRRAEKNQRSFSAEVRYLIESGIERQDYREYVADSAEAANKKENFEDTDKNRSAM